MKFKAWIESKVASAGGPGAVRAARSRLFEAIAANAGLSVRIVREYHRGLLVTEYGIAKAISGYTGGAVTIEELCEGMSNPTGEK